MDSGKYILDFTAKRIDEQSKEYIPFSASGLKSEVTKVSEDEIKAVYKISVSNLSECDFYGVIHVKVLAESEKSKFFMPGYMYNTNTADIVMDKRKAFPRLVKGESKMPESEFFMTRSDRLAEPVSLIYGDGRVLGISAAPYILCNCEEEKKAGRKKAECENADGRKVKFCGFTCNINDSISDGGSVQKGYASAGYTLGYENAPWLFVQTATVLERKPLSEENAFCIPGKGEYSFEVTVYDYSCEALKSELGEDALNAYSNETAIYRAIEDVYWKYHEAPRRIEGMDSKKALELLGGAIRDYAWLEDEKRYTGFVFDKPEGYTYNRIPSISWTNGLTVAVPMLMAANELKDEEARRQSVIAIDEIVRTSYNPASGFLFESTEDDVPSARGWWYDGMRKGGHSSYINGQAVYYILKAYRNEKTVRNIEHKEWLELASKVVDRMYDVMNDEYEYPFAMSVSTGEGLEYDSMGGAWMLAASAMYSLITSNDDRLDALLGSEEHYYTKFVSKAECYAGPLDTDKAVDSEGILSYIRATRLLHEITGKEYLLDHLRDALYYEFTFKLSYNTPVSVRPLSEIGWSSCGGSITSTANPHIHPMSSTVVDEMRYYLKHRSDEYVKSRLEDTIGWGLQTFNTKDGEYGYGKVGWMSERFCFCEGLLTEHYPDGEAASTWFALMPWASASIIEGLADSE